MKIIYLFLVFLISGCTIYGPLVKPSSDVRTVYLEDHPELSDVHKEAIVEKRIIEGMSKDEVRAIWGEPDKISFVKDPERGDREYWDWKGAFFRTFSQDCRVGFFEEKVVSVHCDSFWGK